MNILSQNKVLAAGIAMILLTNIVVIAGAMGNRSGEPDAILDLTERELSMQDWDLEENSGLSLQLNWNGYSYDARNWLGAEKLKELGYELIDSDDYDEIRKYINKQLPRPAWIVLEFDGAAYNNALKDAENKYQEEKRLLSNEQESETQKFRLEDAERNLAWIKNSSSRLYAVDAGPDPAQLRQRYPDKSHYIVTSGLVQVSYDDYGSSRGKMTGYISEINITSIHVPLEHRAVFDSLPELKYIEESSYNPNSFLPRYRVRLAYGQRYEPWIVEVNALQEN